MKTAGHFKVRTHRARTDVMHYCIRDSCSVSTDLSVGKHGGTHGTKRCRRRPVGFGPVTFIQCKSFTTNPKRLTRTRLLRLSLAHAMPTVARGKIAYRV